MNLLDYSATAVPAGFQADGLPWGVTLFAPAFQDVPLLRLVTITRIAPLYKLYALPGGRPASPGMIRTDAGAAIELEVRELPAREFGSFVAGIPAPLGIGTVELADGGKVQGFVCEAYAAAGATDITRFGGWRAWLAEKSA